MLDAPDVSSLPPHISRMMMRAGAGAPARLGLFLPPTRRPSVPDPAAGDRSIELQWGAIQMEEEET